MSDPREKFKAILMSALVGILAATGSAFLSKETGLQKLKTFSAGVTICIATALILTEFNIKEGYKEAICGIVAAFASTMWPSVELRLRNFVDNVEIPFLKAKKKDDKVS